MGTLTRSPSFYGPVPDRGTDEILADYLAFLEVRNGSTATAGAFPKREAWLAETERWDARYVGAVDADAFERSWTRFDPGDPHDDALLALLAFVKVNAGEAYGVEVVGAARHRRPPEGLFDTVERVLGNEETYHTRILVGATAQFDLPRPTGAWRPSLPLRVLIGTLAWSPKVVFHPILLGAEISGVYTFNWMLERVRALFHDQPALRETLEARLIEILIDEIGHIAFNRLAVGPLGLAAARALAPRVAAAASRITPEFDALGWGPGLERFDRFDLASLPEEARRRAFFV
jgi:hypothetical protein